jgi:non-specific serine/threonine protein kinase
MTREASTVAHDVFVSYSSDDKTVGDAVCATLEDRGVPCWIAPRDIFPGQEWAQAIATAIRAARVMVLVFSQGANESPQVRREVERAVHHELVIVPFRIDDVDPESSLEYFLGTPHWLDAITPPLEPHLRDLAEVVEILLAGGGVEAPARPIAERPERHAERLTDHDEQRGNLPIQLSSFVGRQRELDELRRLVDATRLVTLTGPGGSGKTRLALQVAGELSKGSGDGVWLVELAPLADPGRVGATVASVLGIREDPNRPTIDVLVDAVGSRELLVVLDNCEHVVHSVATLAEALLRSCPGIHLLATSREPLGLTGEQVYRVPSLAVPENDDATEQVMASESVRLLLERAAEHKPGFAITNADGLVVARICRRLDGMPLAIELAAARLRSLSPADLDERLDERFRLLTGGSRTALPRQQTLRALIDWSWELLNSAEQGVLARLSVFAGRFDLDGAEAVAASSDVRDYEVLDHLGVLVDKSLVQADDTAERFRYSLLETVRQYGAEKLAESGASEVDRTRSTHLEHYVVLAETAEPQLRARDQVAWLDRLDRDRDNLRAALAYSLALTQPSLGLRFATALVRYWALRGLIVEAADALTALLERADAQPESRAAAIMHARALSAAAYLLHRARRYPAARPYAEEALGIARSAGDDGLLAEALLRLGWVERSQGDKAAALSLAEEALIVARRVGDPRIVERALNLRAGVKADLGDTEIARADFEEALLCCRQTGHRSGAAVVLSNLGDLELRVGNIDAARTRLAESVATARNVRDQFSLLISSWNLGLAEYLDGDFAPAEQLFTECLTRARRIGVPRLAAYGLLGCALANADAGDARRGARLHGAADSAFGSTPCEDLESGLRDADRARLRAALGDEAFASAFAEGRDMPFDEAVSLALGKSRSGPTS